MQKPNLVVKMVFSALLVALSIVLGKILSLTLGAYRISLENLPIILAGIWLGPLGGAIVGTAADLLGCFAVGFVVNPIITLGAAAVGFVAGVTYRANRHTSETRRLALAVFFAHLVGSVFIKSLGLAAYYGYPFYVLIARVPLYFCLGLVEFSIIYAIKRRLSHL